MNRRVFVQRLGLSAAGFSLRLAAGAAAPVFPVVRPAVAQRRFQSKAVEAAIAEFKQQVPDPALAWLFGNCLPNALDTTVTPGTHAGRPDTYVRLGDLDAMGLRDSAAQVWPYLAFVTQDAPLRQLVAGVINRHTRCILQDPYASTFYQGLTRVGESPTAQTPRQPSVHERQWAVDSLCYPIRLAYHYWKTTGDEQPFDAQWRQAIALVVTTFRAQQRPAAASQPPGGLIASAFLPSGKATQLPFSVPGNFFAVTSLRQAALMLNDIHHDDKAYADLMALADEIALALRQHAVVPHPTLGPVYAYAVDGHGGHLLQDAAQVPSLLALPYLGALPPNDPVYQNTRKLVLSSTNPLFYQGAAAGGIGSPRTGADMIWPLSLVLRGLSSTDGTEIRACVQTLSNTHAGTGYLHESFHKDNPTQYTRAWFAAANTLCGEFLWKVYKERPQALN